MSRRILLLNVNTSAALTTRMVDAARVVAHDGTEVVGDQPRWGVSAVQGSYDAYVSVAAGLARLHELLDRPDGAPGPGCRLDALIWAGFGDPGQDAFQEFLDVPVLTLADSAAQLASTVSRRFGVVTTFPRARGQIEDALAFSGLSAHCVGVWAADVSVLDVGRGPDERFVAAGRRALAGGAEAICLGSGALAGMAGPLAERWGVPVVDGVQAAVGLAEACLSMGLRTSERGAYARPDPQERPGWPPAADAGGAGTVPMNDGDEDR